MIHVPIRAALLTFNEVLTRVGKNTEYATLADQYAIRPGLLRERDPYPGIVLALPTTTIDGDLSGRGGFAVATLQVRAIALVLDAAWDLQKAVCWNGGDPDDVNRKLSGLDGYRNIAGNGLQAIKLKSFAEFTHDPQDKSDRCFSIVQGTFDVEFDVAMIATGG